MCVLETSMKVAKQHYIITFHVETKKLKMHIYIYIYREMPTTN